MTLYILLKPVQRSMARAMLVLVALATGIISLNAVFQFEALRVATDSSYATAFGTAGSNALVLLLLDTQHSGTLITQVFFGLWLVPLGYLAYKSGLFPKALGVLLVGGGVCLFMDMLAQFLIPDFGQQISTVGMNDQHNVGSLPSAIAEVWIVGYLLIIGVNHKARQGHPRRGGTGSDLTPLPTFPHMRTEREKEQCRQ